MDEIADAEHGEDDEAERQFQNGPAVVQQPLFRNAPAVQKKKRRQEHQEEDIGIELHAQIAERIDDRAQRDLDQRQGKRQARDARQRAADDNSR